jgi:hypothetical protein
MVSQQLDPLAQSSSVQRFNSYRDVGVERTPPLVEDAAVGDLVGECVLKRLLQVWEEVRLIEELGCL